MTVVFSYFLQGLIISNRQEFTNWLSGFGPFVVLVYILLQAATVIFAPLGGFFLVVAMIALFGPAFALTIGYLVTAPCYLLNFYLARRYGRPLVEKIIGTVTIKKIDHYVQDAGTLTLIILRLFQGGNFDYLSYGLGLTKISFRAFALVNFLVGIPGTLISYFVITRFDNLASSVIAFYTMSVFLGGMAIYLNHRIRKHKSLKLF